MQYRIAWRNAQWQLFIEGQECALLQSDDRAYLVNIACKVAADRDATVQVFDAGDASEALVRFDAGRLSFADGRRDRLRAVPAAAEPDAPQPPPGA